MSEMCPVQESMLKPDDELVLPLHKRVICQYIKDDSGMNQLHLFYDEKEILFDDPALFGFGEALAKQQRFTAGEASEWGNGYEWEQVQPLLRHLVQEGVLLTPTDVDIKQQNNVLPQQVEHANPLTPASIKDPATWFECETVTQALIGRPVEMGHLELIVPIFRIVHMNLDAEGRQVGEANVFPPAMRLDIPTRWRTCTQPGSRFQSDRPMNVTALKSMRQYWKPIMRCLLTIRQAYCDRYPEVHRGWTVGHMERLSTLVLALPAYLMMRKHDRVPNGELHPVFSCMFRVTDGLRLTLHHMLFLPVIEKTLDADTPMTAVQLFDYAERNYSFFSPHAVCAGPKTMIKEFLDVMFDGTSEADVASAAWEPAVEQGMAQLDDAFKYGLYGLQAHAVVFSMWPMMTRYYETLWHIVTDWELSAPQFLAFKKLLKSTLIHQRGKSLLADKTQRHKRDLAFQDMYEQSSAGLNSSTTNTSTHVSLQERIAAKHLPQHDQAKNKLTVVIKQRFDISSEDPVLVTFVDSLMDYFREEQSIVRVASDIQTNINYHLQRPQPKNPFTAADTDVYNQLLGEFERIPYLSAELEQLLGISIVVSKDQIDIQSDKA